MNDASTANNIAAETNTDPKPAVIAAIIFALRHEREACAKLAEDEADVLSSIPNQLSAADGAKNVAERIRSRA